jgi:hypothetical protein
MRNLRNLHLSWLSDRPKRVFTLLAILPFEFILVMFPEARLAFWSVAGSLAVWVLVTLLLAEVTVDGEQLRYRSWFGMRSVGIESARNGILVRRGNRLTILVPQGSTALSRPLALRTVLEWSELLQTTSLERHEIDKPCRPTPGSVTLLADADDAYFSSGETWEVD